MDTKSSTQFQSNKSFYKEDIATALAIAITIGISCYYLFLLSAKYYSPLSDFFAFKEIAEELIKFNLVIGSKRLPVYPFLMGLVAQIIPAKKAILYAGILISTISYIGSIFLIHKISQQIGIKNSFLVSWFFAFSSLPLYCATQPLPEATILFLILLSLYVKRNKLSLLISGLATFTRYDASIAIFANIPKILIEKKRRLMFLVFLLLLLSVIFLGFYYLKAGATGYIGAVIGPKPFTTDKIMGDFISLSRTINLFYMPDDHPATMSPESRFHTQWWMQLIWIINIFVIFVGAFHLIKLNKLNHWKIHAFFLLYFLFLWFYYYTNWRKMYFIVWLFPLYTIAGIEYFILRWQKKQKSVIALRVILGALLVILGIIVVYSAYNTPYIKILYHEFFSLSFEINSLKRFLIFLPICGYVFFKLRQSKSKRYLVLLPLFFTLTPLVSSHISTVNNMYGDLWDLKAGMKVVKKVIKRDEKIFMPDKMVHCATYLSDIPEKNIVTYHSKNLSPGDIKYIASFKSWDKDPILQQLENNPKKIMIGNQKIRVTQIYHVALFRLYALGTITAHGNVWVDSSQSKFGGASGLFDGAGSRLQAVDSPDWAFSSKDFTIDFWVRFASTSGTQVLVGYPYYSPNKAWQIAWEEEFNSLKFAYSTDGSNNTDARFPWSPSADTWYHVAMVRDGSDLKAFVNGSQIGSTYNIGNASIHDSNDPLYIGSRGNEEHFSGWLDEIRISKGIARWATDFTPSSGEYSIDIYTELLLHCNGRVGSKDFPDDSGNPPANP